MIKNIKYKVVKVFEKKTLKEHAKIKMLWGIINEKIKSGNSIGRYCFFSNSYAHDYLDICSKENDYEKMKFFYDMINDWDNICNLPLEIGEYLERLCQSDDRTIAIYKTNLGELVYHDNIPINGFLKSIVQDGLKNFGQINSGVHLAMPIPKYIVTPLASFPGFINLIGSYKNNNVTVVLNFPSEFVDPNCDFVTEESANQIYDFVNGLPYIKPEFIDGVIVKNADGLDKYYSRSEIAEVASLGL